MDEQLPIGDILEAAGHLPGDAPLEAVETWLDTLADLLTDADPSRRALVREAAIARLKTVNCVGAAAAVVDAFLGTQSSSGADLQGKAMEFSDPERWPEPVDGAELLDELARTFRRFLALPPGADVLLALWTVHAHALDAASISPVLAITSPVKRCGKTTLLHLLSCLVPRPLAVSNLTAATLFRSIEKFQPTLLIDEVDTFA